VAGKELGLHFRTSWNSLLLHESTNAKASPSPDSIGYPSEMKRESKNLIAVGVVVTLGIGLIFLTTYTDSPGGIAAGDKFKNMSEAEHVRAAYEAMNDTNWELARTHLFAVRPPVIVKPTPEIQSAIDACIAASVPNDDSTFAMIEACKSKNDPNYRGHAGADIAGCVTPTTEKRYTIEERKLIDCTVRPLSCETVIDSQGRKQLCPSEAPILTDRLNKTMQALNAVREREWRDQQKRLAESAEAERRTPDAWDILPIEHKKEMMTVLNAGYWQGGEYRVCGIEVSKSPTVLDCSLDPVRKEVNVRLDVVFDGSMENSQWDCQRRPTDVYCKPLKKT
jgi:hypothetical protein